MLDVSFTGGWITIRSAAMGGPTTISEFADDGSPVEVDEIEVTGHSINLNGTIIRWRKPTGYTVKVSVIPLSDNDRSLAKLLEASHVRPSGSGVLATTASDLLVDMDIYAPALNYSSGNGEFSGSEFHWQFTEGSIVSGGPCVTSDAEGKMQTKTYTFIFERMETVSELETPLKAGTTSLTD